MQNTDKDSSSSLMLGFNILEALMGFAACGAKNIELATAVNTSPSNITRVMNVIIEKGWARKGDNGRFYPAPAFSLLAFRALDDFTRLEKTTATNKLVLTGVHTLTFDQQGKL